MGRYVNGELKQANPTVIYLCNGKDPRCSGSFYCLTECKHTIDVRYAKNFVQLTTAYGEGEYWEKDPEEEGDERGKQMGTED